MSHQTGEGLAGVQMEGKGDVKIVEFTGVGYDPIVPVKEQRL